MRGVELPVGDSQRSRLVVGCGGVVVSIIIGLPTTYRLVRLLRCFEGRTAGVCRSEAVSPSAHMPQSDKQFRSLFDAILFALLI